MRILFFYESMALGGQQTQTYQLVRRLSCLGHNVSWTFLSGDDLLAKVTRYASAHRIPYSLEKKEYLRRPWRIPQIASALTAHARGFGADVIISGSGIGSLVCGLAARRIGISHYRLVGCSIAQVERMLHRFYRWIAIDTLIDGYFGWPAVFAELRSKGVPERKFIELNDAVDTEMFKPLPEHLRSSIRQELGIKEDELVIGWIGRIAQNMQVGNTVQLGAELRRRGFDRFRLLLIGGGPWVEGIRKLIVELGLVDHAILTDWVPMEKVNQYVNATDIVPLLESDPQGGSCMRESMACGRVALSVDGPSGTQRRFMHPDCAVLVPSERFLYASASAVLALARDKDELLRIGKNARLYSEKYMSFDTQVSIILRALLPGDQ
jgi:glycosyltransferase involved in cell wall biosynthesis